MTGDDLGRIGATHRFATEIDIRSALEVTSTDPAATAFACLVSPNAAWRARLLDPNDRARIGTLALDRYCEIGSTMPGDYADLLPTGVDPFTFEWSASDPFARPPTGSCVTQPVNR